jgi:chromosome partitioning protein
MTKAYLVANNKGGVLKTTITVNLAGYLAQDLNLKVLIVDTDNQGNVSSSFGIDPDELETTLFEVLTSENPQKEVLKSIIKVHDNIDIIPSRRELALLDYQVNSNKVKYPNPFKLLGLALDEIEDLYDVVLIDSPPAIGLIQGNSLAYADQVLIPLQPELYAMRSLVKMIEIVEEAKENLNPSIEISGVIPTLVDTKTNLHNMAIEHCRMYCKERGIKMMKGFIPKSIAFANAISLENKPATLTNSKNKAVNSIREIAEEIFV